MSESDGSSPLRRLLDAQARIEQEGRPAVACELSILAPPEVRTGADLLEALRSLGRWAEVVGAISREVESLVSETLRTHERALLQIAARISFDVRDLLELLLRALAEARWAPPKLVAPRSSIEDLLRAAVALRESERAVNDGSLLFARAYELAREDDASGKKG